MAAQDDAREREMRTLFNLTRPEEYGRSDGDAVLELKGRAIPAALRGKEIPFELKSATSGRPNISTVRDFGLDLAASADSGPLAVSVLPRAAGPLGAVARA